MKIKRPFLIVGAAGIVVLVAAIWFLQPNELGLTGFDILLSGRPELAALRTNTKAAADVFLAQHKTELMGASGQKDELSLDFSKSSKIRSLGYRSSFYYYCWDIYLPYSLRKDASNARMVIVQLSDSLPGNRHDSQKFHVIRAMYLDNQSKVIKEINLR